VRVIDTIALSIRTSAQYNPDVEVRPSCILWPDRERQWESIIPGLQDEMPELFVFGDYNPKERTGPAIWLRCIVYLFLRNDESQAKDNIEPAFSSIQTGKHLPVIYLPGISRQDLRAVESCPDSLKPLAELQYRGTIWSQLNAKDWTILAFLKSEQGGLGLDVAMDKDTKKSMRLALRHLLDEDVELLKGKRLDNDFFNNLLTGGDPIRDILQWINSPNEFRNSLDENHWNAFVGVCKSLLGFDPQKMGGLMAASALAEHKGQWKIVWERFCEAPGRYPYIPIQIRKCKPPSGSLAWFIFGKEFEGWPQWNDEQEDKLRQDFLQLNKMPAHDARQKIIQLEKNHVSRRNFVWAELGQAPLAKALQHLAIMAEVTQNALAAGTLEDMASGYSSWGWKADNAMVKSLSFIKKLEDLKALTVAIRSVYLPWAEDSARYLQDIWWERYNKGAVQEEKNSFKECCLFVDGLRFDCAKNLISLLEEKNLSVSQQLTWAALPSVTSTGKPAASPVGKHITRQYSQPENFDPCTSHYFKKLLQEINWTIRKQNESLPGPSELVHKKLWLEFGNIDHEGHERGWKLAGQIDGLLSEIRERILTLFELGWTEVRVVTDHGWLMLPGSLPKIDLPKALTTTKWSRCAEIKSGAHTDEKLYPWYWDSGKHFALADGISCFRKNDEYSHGGLSLQECLLLELTVFGGSAIKPKTSIVLTDAVWKGLRCTVAVEGSFEELWLDVRMNAGDPDSSLVLNIKPLKKSGSASVVVEDDELEGRQAYIVLLNEQKQLILQQVTVIAEEN